MYRKQVAASRRTEVATENEIVKCLGPLMNKAIFINQRKKFGMFASEKEAIEHSTTILRPENLTLLPKYRGKYKAQIRIGQISPEIRETWLVTAVIVATKGNTRWMFVGRTKQLNWWGMAWRY